MLQPSSLSFFPSFSGRKKTLVAGCLASSYPVAGTQVSYLFYHHVLHKQMILAQKTAALLLNMYMKLNQHDMGVMCSRSKLPWVVVFWIFLHSIQQYLLSGKWVFFNMALLMLLWPSLSLTSAMLHLYYTLKPFSCLLGIQDLKPEGTLPASERAQKWSASTKYVTLHLIQRGQYIWRSHASWESNLKLR